MIIIIINIVIIIIIFYCYNYYYYHHVIIIQFQVGSIYSTVALSVERWLSRHSFPSSFFNLNRERAIKSIAERMTKRNHLSNGICSRSSKERKDFRKWCHLSNYKLAGRMITRTVSNGICCRSLKERKDFRKTCHLIHSVASNEISLKSVLRDLLKGKIENRI